MSQPWPPPPDLHSIQELMRAADPEGLLQTGAPADEYDPEEREFFAAIGSLPTAQIIAADLLVVLESIWRKSFSLDGAGMARARPALTSLAHQVEHFFGPQAQPQVRATRD